MFILNKVPCTLESKLYCLNWILFSSCPVICCIVNKFLLLYFMYNCCCFYYFILYCCFYILTLFYFIYSRILFFSRFNYELGIILVFWPYFLFSPRNTWILFHSINRFIISFFSKCYWLKYNTSYITEVSWNCTLPMDHP